MTQEELRKEVSDYLRCQTQLNGGGLIFHNINNLVSGFAEKLNAQITDLERKLEQTEKDLADYQFNYPTIKELEKENARLKTNEKTLLAERKIIVKENEKLRSIAEFQQSSNMERGFKLGKAKKTIEALIGIIDYLNDDEYGKEDFPVVHEAEAFLKEIKEY